MSSSGGGGSTIQADDLDAQKKWQDLRKKKVDPIMVVCMLIIATVLFLTLFLNMKKQPKMNKIIVLGMGIIFMVMVWSLLKSTASDSA